MTRKAAILRIYSALSTNSWDCPLFPLPIGPKYGERNESFYFWIMFVHNEIRWVSLTVDKKQGNEAGEWEEIRDARAGLDGMNLN